MAIVDRSGKDKAIDPFCLFDKFVYLVVKYAFVMREAIPTLRAVLYWLLPKLKHFGINVFQLKDALHLFYSLHSGAICMTATIYK